MKIRFNGSSTLEDDGFGAPASFGGMTWINGRIEAGRFGSVDTAFATFSAVAAAGRTAVDTKSDGSRTGNPSNTPISTSTALPTDPLLGSQWHLGNSTPGLLDLNVRGVWNPAHGAAYTGAGVRVLVIDDGFDYTHSDLAPNYDQGLDFDWDGLNNGSNGDHDLDPFGQNSDSHGTAVTGIIGADDNGTGVVGVAFNSSLVGYRTHGFITDGWLQDIRDSIHHAAMSAQADVANISQGIANDANSEFGIGYNATRFDEIETSIATAVNDGRGGLGMTIVKSAGNSRSDNYDVNADDWTNDTRQVVVAAVDQDGFVSSYSSYGAALLVSAFGTPGQVLTTDRVGSAGYNSTDFTSGFNGTSAAAPMVAGVVALMYDANAGLGWRDVQSILANSARHVGSDFGAPSGAERYQWQWTAASTWNGGGLHFSNDYGYGLVDALAAVRLAETWLFGGYSAATSGNQFTNTMDMLNAATVIPDGNATGLTFTGSASFDDIVERVTVTLNFSTTFTGDLELYLISPDGTISELIDDVGSGTDFNGEWTFETQAFRGERAAGTWSVRIVDDAGVDVLTVSDVIVRTFGADTTGDRYIFTDEFAAYAGIGNHATAITDSNGGTDIVNAAAVTSSSIIRLDGTAGVIDGIGVSFTNIENAVGGDGNDLIVGDGNANSLWGMRGNDTLHGGSGTDQLFGGDGDDTLVQNFGGPNELMDGGDGIDTGDWSYSIFDAWVFDLGAGTAKIGDAVYADLVSIENVIGGALNDEIIGNFEVNVLHGGGGDDTIRAQGSNDWVYGDSGNDTLYGDTGTDFVSGGDDNDLVIILGGDGLDDADGGAGVDTLDYATAFSGDINFNMTTGVFNFAGNLRTATTFENYIDSESNGTITGTNGVNVINGNGGNDVIEGRFGADILDGGAGIDTASYVSSGARVVARLNGGANTNGDAAGDILLNFENLIGSAFNDSLIGADLVDNRLDGGGANDFLYGLSGNDTLEGGTGADTLDGGAGIDTASYSTSNARVVVRLNGGANTGGHAAGDTLIGIENLVGSGYNDSLIGANLVDNRLEGGGSDDYLYGLSGNDTLIGGLGHDQLFGAEGDDVLDGGDGQDMADGGDGNDTITTGTGIDTVLGGAGHDTIDSGGGNDTIDGGDGDDIVQASAGDDTINGGAGNDIITAGSGVDTVNGGIGDDTIFGITGVDTINGGDGNDVIEGGTDADALDGGAGVDTVSYAASSGAVTVRLNGGAITGGDATGDTLLNFENITGSNHSDTLIGANAVANVLQGGMGNDFLGGMSGNDTLLGGDGNDRLDGGLNNDTLGGGVGLDTFIFNSALSATNIDTITDFVVADDIFHIDDAVFVGGGLVAGALSAAQFVIGAAATTAAHRIIYNAITGTLSYDADGAGGNAAVQFATLAAGLSLTEADFFVI